MVNLLIRRGTDYSEKVPLDDVFFIVGLNEETTITRILGYLLTNIVYSRNSNQKEELDKYLRMQEIFDKFHKQSGRIFKKIGCRVQGSELRSTLWFLASLEKAADEYFQGMSEDDVTVLMERLFEYSEKKEKT